MKKITFLLAILLSAFVCKAELPDSCKLKFGVGVGGITFWGTNIPFVDMMRCAKKFWICDSTKPRTTHNEYFDSLSWRDDGYPTHLPQNLDSLENPQIILTIFANTVAWPSGTYTLLYDGIGELEFDNMNVVEKNDNKILLEYTGHGKNIALIIISSDIDDPLHNIRILIPGTEDTYETQPFNQVYLDKIKDFTMVRLGGWDCTYYQWKTPIKSDWENSTLVDWDERTTMKPYYTWDSYALGNMGIPYEMMIRFLNEMDMDGWLSVPPLASDDYIRNMAHLFKDNLEPERRLYIEYSNEIWNWHYSQTQWLNKYGCEEKGEKWPEGIVPYIQNCMDIWSEVWADELDRLTRVVAVQTGYQNVSNRIVFNMRPGSFDALGITFYFKFSEEADSIFDELGENTTVADIAYHTRQQMYGLYIDRIRLQKKTIADSLNIPIVFYEGGEHLTPSPQGTEPTYPQALLDIQRDTSVPEYCQNPDIGILLN